MLCVALMVSSGFPKFCFKLSKLLQSLLKNLFFHNQAIVCPSLGQPFSHPFPDEIRCWFLWWTSFLLKFTKKIINVAMFWFCQRDQDYLLAVSNLEGNYQNTKMPKYQNPQKRETCLYLFESFCVLCISIFWWFLYSIISDKCRVYFRIYLQGLHRLEILKQFGQSKHLKERSAGGYYFFTQEH